MFSIPEIKGEVTLVADRLTEEDAAELERLVRRKGDILTDDNAPPFAAEETATFERLLGKAAGDEGLFEQRRRDAAARATLDNLGDVRRVAKLPRQPLLAEPGSVQLPRFAVHDWLVGPEAHEGAWTVLDLGLLVVIRGCFANRDATPFVGGQFEETDGDLVLVNPRRHRQRGSPPRTDRRRPRPARRPWLYPHTPCAQHARTQRVDRGRAYRRRNAHPSRQQRA